MSRMARAASASLRHLVVAAIPAPPTCDWRRHRLLLAVLAALALSLCGRVDPANVSTPGRSIFCASPSERGAVYPTPWRARQRTRGRRSAAERFGVGRQEDFRALVEQVRRKCTSPAELAGLVLEAQGELESDFPPSDKRTHLDTGKKRIYRNFRKKKALRYPRSKIRDLWNTTFTPLPSAEGPSDEPRFMRSLLPVGAPITAVRVVAMSDTHGFHHELTVPPGDILVHCGDFMKGYRRADAVKDFARWFKGHPHQVKLLVPGNHEQGAAKFGLQRYLGKFVPHAVRDCLGLTVFGLPFDKRGTPYARIPPGVDLLLTHEPPRGILDVSLFSGRREKTDEPVHIGSKILRASMEGCTKPPRVHIFGHVHEGHGRRMINGTVYVNAANANPGPAKCLTHACTVLDIPFGRHSTSESTAALVQS